MKHLGLFAGFGGFELAARWAGWKTVAWCEWNEFCQKVLKYHFPDAVGHSDITQTDFTVYANKVDVLTGGFPCQPYSLAGQRKGTEDERHLWPEMLRAIREIQPKWVVGENVRGIVSWNAGLVFEQVQADLEAEGYEVLTFILPACGVNAPHKRDRVWFVAYADNKRRRTRFGEVSTEDGEIPKWHKDAEFSHSNKFSTTNANSIRRRKGLGTSINHNRWQASDIERCNNRCDNRQERCFQRNKRTAEENKSERNRWECGTCTISSINANTCNQGLQGFKKYRSIRSIRKNGEEQFTGYVSPDWTQFPTQPPICGGDDGISAELDGITFSKWRTESIKGYGNAIVPQVALRIFNVINEMMKND